MAMRLYTKEEFEAELREKWDLIPTSEKFKTYRIWKTRKGHFLTVPILPAGERYPDYFLDTVLEQRKAVDASEI